MRKWPGRKTFGVYRFLPVFFVLGAALEWAMINFRVGQVNFYSTFKKRQVEEIVERKLFLEEIGFEIPKRS